MRLKSLPLGRRHKCRGRHVAVTCGEPTWWRGRRRMIADLATRDGHHAQHLMPDGSLSTHRATDWLTRGLDYAADNVVVNG